MRSDLLSYWLLHTYGGVYFDLDFDFYRPIPDEMMSHQTWLATQPDRRTNCAAMGSVANSKAFEEILNAARRATAKAKARTLSFRTMFGPTLLTRLRRTRRLVHTKFYGPDLFYKGSQSRIANHLNGIDGSSYRTT